MINKENSWFAPLFAELTVTNMAHFAVLSILTVHIVGTLGFSAIETAIVLCATSIGLRFSRVALAPFIDRITPRRIIPVAIIISLVGYLGMSLSEQVLPVAFFMLLVGTGYGLNGMLVTTLASYTAQSTGVAFPVYALMNAGTNLAAALAPPISNWLRLEVSSASPFLFSAFILCVSLLVSTRIRSDIPSNYRGIRFSKAILPLLSDPKFWSMMGFVMAGWMVYTQKFAATPLFIEHFLQEPSQLGFVIAVNAVIVLFLSLPAASFIRFHRLSGKHVLTASFALYALAYTILALSPTLTGLWSALVTWSLGEALLMPQLNALIAEHTHSDHRLAGFSLTAVAIGIGEAVGNTAGAILLGATLTSGNPGLCYAIFAALALIACISAFRQRQPKEALA